MAVRKPKVLIKTRAHLTAGYWSYRIKRNISDHPWASLAIVVTVLLGICLAIAIIGASNGIQDTINAKLHANDPGQAQRIKQFGINLKDIQDVLRTTRGVLSKLAIGLTAIFVGVVTLLSMARRRREIALCRQQGMHMREVLGMLLGESFVLCLIGGILGIIAGNVLCAVVNKMSPLLPMEPMPGDILAIFAVTTFLAILVTAVIAYFFARFVSVTPDLN